MFKSSGSASVGDLRRPALVFLSSLDSAAAAGSGPHTWGSPHYSGLDVWFAGAGMILAAAAGPTLVEFP